jgi:hypothetical protein
LTGTHPGVRCPSLRKHLERKEPVKFLHAADASANMAELKKVSSWMQDSYIEKGGWATFPGMTSPERGVAQACATLLTTLH